MRVAADVRFDPRRHRGAKAASSTSRAWPGTAYVVAVHALARPRRLGVMTPSVRTGAGAGPFVAGTLYHAESRFRAAVVMIGCGV